MQNLNRLEAQTYDPRWFIWTVVFLIVSGVSLASYILITTAEDSSDTAFVTVQHAVTTKQTQKASANVSNQPVNK